MTFILPRIGNAGKHNPYGNAGAGGKHHQCRRHDLYVTLHGNAGKHNPHGNAGAGGKHPQCRRHDLYIAPYGNAGKQSREQYKNFIIF